MNNFIYKICAFTTMLLSFYISYGDIIFVRNISDDVCTIALEKNKNILGIKQNIPNDGSWHQFRLMDVNDTLEIFFIHPTPFSSQLHERANVFVKTSKSSYKPIENKLDFHSDKEKNKAHYITIVNRVDSDVEYECCNAPLN